MVPEGRSMRGWHMEWATRAGFGIRGVGMTGGRHGACWKCHSMCLTDRAGLTKCGGREFLWSDLPR